jgi:hypothetical protein
MPEDKKKNFKPYKGNKVNQGGEFPFIENFKTWRRTCQGISGESLQTKNVPNLYMFLKTHMMGNIRAGSRNKGLDGQGAIQFLEVIETFVDNDLFTEAQASLIEQLAETLADMKDTGEDAGGKTPAFDPAFILFTEQEKTKTGQKKRPRTVQGHYATEWYAARNEGVSAVPAEWLAGNNPPHQALFSETKTKYANPKGLLYIMQEASEFLDDMEIEVEVQKIPSGVDEVDIDEIKSVERFFNDVVTNTAYWNPGGRLLTNKVRASLKATTFEIRPNEQAAARKITNVGKEGDKDALTGDVVGIKLTALPIINLVDRALKRKNTNKAPNGFRAWQSDRKTGFDYRKTAREKYPDTYQDKDFKLNPNQKVISKMWQQLLWRD